jgi:hypothetical protein
MLDKIRNRLDRLGIAVNYIGGNYCAISTEYRGGNNPNGAWCYENNIWDAIESRFLTWEKFVSICKKISEVDAKKWLAGADIDDGEQEQEEEVKEKIKVQKVLVESDYADLVKSYDFFLRRGISKETLDYVGAGLAQNGPLYGRIVFKIRDDKGKLIGAAGRDALNRGERGVVKWKLKGSKSDWIYPAFEKNLDAIQRTKQIIIVESIGDVLQLCESGIYNVLCNFGLSFSSSRLSFLLKINPTSIFLGLNDDAESLENRGQIAAAKIKVKLSTFFAEDKIINSPPSKGDFGEMNKDQILNWADSFGVKY